MIGPRGTAHDLWGRLPSEGETFYDPTVEESRENPPHYYPELTERERRARMKQLNPPRRWSDVIGSASAIHCGWTFFDAPTTLQEGPTSHSRRGRDKRALEMLDGL